MMTIFKEFLYLEKIRLIITLGRFFIALGFAPHSWVAERLHELANEEECRSHILHKEIQDRLKQGE